MLHIAKNRDVHGMKYFLTDRPKGIRLKFIVFESVDLLSVPSENLNVAISIRIRIYISDCIQSVYTPTKKIDTP